MNSFASYFSKSATNRRHKIDRVVYLTFGELLSVRFDGATPSAGFFSPARRGIPFSYSANNSFAMKGPAMWIVKLALNRPYTFVVMALLFAVFDRVYGAQEADPTLIHAPTRKHGT